MIFAKQDASQPYSFLQMDYIRRDSFHFNRILFEMNFRTSQAFSKAEAHYGQLDKFTPRHTTHSFRRYRFISWLAAGSHLLWTHNPLATALQSFMAYQTCILGAILSSRPETEQIVCSMIIWVVELLTVCSAFQKNSVFCLFMK